MNKETLRKRYEYLWRMELLSAAIFPALVGIAAVRDGRWEHLILRTYGVALFAMILLQGTAWWRWKLAVLRGAKDAIPSRVLGRYRLWKLANWLLIGLFPLVVVLVARPLAGRSWSVDLTVGLLLLAGAVLEQVNYYYYQLMYDTRHDWNYLRLHRRLRRGNIAAALDAAKSR